MQNIPVQTVDAWIRFGSDLEAKKLIPALVQCNSRQGKQWVSVWVRVWISVCRMGMCKGMGIGLVCMGECICTFPFVYGHVST